MVHKDNINMCFKLENYIENDKFVNTFIMSAISWTVHIIGKAKQNKTKTVSCLKKDGHGS